uniref:Peptidyl-prolyl cis-trans isomerase n=1 Tax=Chaetoceros debilis TaxID=122233 RepID=A0A7S3PZR0_9STRA|eukprot:CAMPEP_0194081776 /NCGR_PEP_ID=MMETSP0149-20130528/7467_1 /TAXON_ID=122233 /ORGANISM="Chaetoceros debilis, Strain MM31A-1" /LENGTH=164 /DNA_ID=CAMNT_0038763759 /DNA_START=65 /DNA_END=559 /DNA_ORIENTATION=+
MNFISFLFTIALIGHFTEAFTVSSPSRHGGRGMAVTSSPLTLGMGLFDGISKAFGNEEYGAPPDAVKASARHILVKTTEEATTIMDKMASGSAFADLAREFSTCPSGKSGGSLGSFEPGTMVPEFDKVIFSPDTPMGTVMGPVETKFGYHLIVVDKRTGGGDWY